MVCERSIGYFETRVDWPTLKSDNSKETSRDVSLKVEKAVVIGKFLTLKCFVGEGENFVLDALINFEPV